MLNVGTNPQKQIDIRMSAMAKMCANLVCVCVSAAPQCLYFVCNLINVYVCDGCGVVTIAYDCIERKSQVSLKQRNKFTASGRVRAQTRSRMHIDFDVIYARTSRSQQATCYAYAF